MSAIEPVSIRDLPYVIEPRGDWPLIREILRRFEYDPITGIVRYRVAFNHKAPGDIAGSVWSKRGIHYLKICCFNRTFILHRVIFVLMRGEWPQGVIDHINRNGLDNRWCNLRDVPRTVNARNRQLQSNNSSGIAGVTWNKPTNKWRVRIGTNSARNFIGVAATLDEARELRLKAELEAGGYISDLTPADAMPPHLANDEPVDQVGWLEVASHGLG